MAAEVTLASDDVEQLAPMLAAYAEPWTMPRVLSPYRRSTGSRSEDAA